MLPDDVHQLGLEIANVLDTDDYSMQTKVSAILIVAASAARQAGVPHADAVDFFTSFFMLTQTDEEKQKLC